MNVLNQLASGGTSPASLYDPYQRAQANTLNRNALNQRMTQQKTQFDQEQLRGMQEQVNQGLVQLVGEVGSAPEEARPQLWQRSLQRIAALHPALGQHVAGMQYDPQTFAALEGGLRERGLLVAQKQMDPPSDVREWEYFTRLNPEQQQQYLSMKRASRTVDLGNRQAVLGPTGNIVQSYDKAPPVQETPQFKQQQAEASARGKALGEVEEKRPALDSWGIAKKAMLDSVASTPTGGPLGLRGKTAKTTDYQKAQQFEQRRQQLSTEVRTVFRIPGEGTLTEQEQAQYGIQLPDMNNDKEINEQIMRELDARVAARMRQPIPSTDAPQPQTPGAFADPEKERRYQEWKASQGK